MHKVVSVSDIRTGDWETLVRESPVTSWFQTREAYLFFKAQPFLEAFAWGVESDGCLKGVVVGFIQKEGGRIKQFFSRRAIINGGPLLAEDIAPEALALLLSACKKALRGKVIYAECRNYADYTPYKEVFVRCGFAYQPHLDFHVDTTGMDVVDANMGKSRKRDVKASLKAGAQVVEHPTLDEVRAYYAVLEDLYRRKVKTPLFPWSFFESLHGLENAVFLLVRYNERIIGGTTCVCLPGHTVYEWFACGEDGVHKNVYPSTLATYSGISYAAREDYRRFDMMGAGKPDDSYGVRDFKAKFGGRLLELGRFRAILHPVLFGIGCLGLKIMKLL